MSLIIQVKSQVDGRKKYIKGKDLSKYGFDNTEGLLGIRVIMEDNSVWFVCGYGDSGMVMDCEEE